MERQDDQLGGLSSQVRGVGTLSECPLRLSRRASLRGWAPHPVRSRYKRLTQPGSKGSGRSRMAQPAPRCLPPRWWNKPVPTPPGEQMCDILPASTGEMELLQGFFSSYVSYLAGEPKEMKSERMSPWCFIGLHQSLSTEASLQLQAGMPWRSTHCPQRINSHCATPLIYPLQVPLQAWSSIYFLEGEGPPHIHHILHPHPTCVKWITMYWQQTPEELLTTNPSVWLRDSFIRTASV